MENLVIDIGNTRYKWGIFEGKNLLKAEECTEKDEFLVKIKQFSFDNVILSSVRDDTSFWLAYLPKNTLLLSPDLEIPILNLYESPQTLGMDRLAAAIGAKSFFPEQPCLVIDLGTCITYDFISADNKFLGGMIAPGVRMRLEAMHHFTQKLPFISWQPEQDIKVIGNTTERAMLSGAVNGVKGEIYSTRQYYQALYPDLQTILCGGDSPYFESIKKGDTFAVPKLVLYGLNQILNYHLQKL